MKHFLIIVLLILMIGFSACSPSITGDQTRTTAELLTHTYVVDNILESASSLRSSNHHNHPSIRTQTTSLSVDVLSEQQSRANAETEANHATTKTTSAAPASDAVYILNTNTHKFHRPNCASVKDMSDKNKKESDASRQEIIDSGYSPCGRCHP